MEELLSTMKLAIRMGFGLMLCGLVLVSGCQTPDLEPFASATASLASAVNDGGRLAVAVLEESPFEVEGKRVEPNDPRHPGSVLKEEWETRVQMMDALAAYGSSLVAIVDCSRNGKVNAEAMLGTVNSFANRIPGVSAFSPEAGGLIVHLAGTLIELKAYYDLSQAVGEADKAIQEIAVILAKNIASLGKVYVGGDQKISGQLATDLRQKRTTLYKLDKEREQYEQLAKSLEKERDKLKKELLKCDANDLNTPDMRKKEQRLRIYTSDVEVYLAKVRSLDKPRSDAQAAVAKAEEELSGHRRETLQVVAMLEQAEKSVALWARTHADLKVALDENRRPNVILLAQKAMELKGAVEALRNRRK